MILHVDTSFLVDLLREQGRAADGPASDYLRGHLGDEYQMSVFVACELHAGAELSGQVTRETEKVTELCKTIPVVQPEATFALAYGSILAHLERNGERIPTMDLLIATTAVVAQAPLLTRNSKHFQRVPGLHVEEY